MRATSANATERVGVPRTAICAVDDLEVVGRGLHEVRGDLDAPSLRTIAHALRHELPRDHRGPAAAGAAAERRRPRCRPARS